MKRLLIILVAALFAVGTVQAQDQDQSQPESESLSFPLKVFHSLELYANTGRSIQLHPEEFKEFWHVGRTYNVGLGFRVGEGVTVRPTVSYTRFAVLEGSLVDEPTYTDGTGDGTIKTVSSTVDFVLDYAEGGWFIPYGVAGLGVYEQVENQAEIDKGGGTTMVVEPNYKRTLALNLGLGFRIYPVHYVSINIEGKGLLGFVAGGNRLYAPVNVGITVRP